MTDPILETAEAAHHADNQRRFIAIEAKLDANTAVTEKQAADTADLLAMWKDAGVFFKWMRRLGDGLMWVSKIAIAAGALYAAWRYGVPKS